MHLKHISTTHIMQILEGWVYCDISRELHLDLLEHKNVKMTYLASTFHLDENWSRSPEGHEASI